MDCRRSAPPPAMAGRKREANRFPMPGKVRESGFQCLEKPAKPGSNVWKTSREGREGRNEWREAWGRGRPAREGSEERKEKHLEIFDNVRLTPAGSHPNNVSPVHSRMETKPLPPFDAELPRTRWSTSGIESTLAVSTSLRVRAMSAVLGVGSPEG